MSNTDTEGEFTYKPAKPDPATDGLLPATTNMRSAKLAQTRAAPAMIKRLPDITPTPEEQEAFDSLAISIEQDKEKKADFAGVDLAPEVRARAGCVVAHLGGLAMGKPWAECSKRSGISFIASGCLATYDKAGYGALLKAAEAAQDQILVAKMKQALHKRAVEGVENYKIGRIEKDRDGIVRDEAGNPIIERKYSDKLLEFGLSKLAPKQFGDAPAAANIGQQVIYNITALNVGQHAPQPQAIEADEVKAGDNPAIIDIDSIGDLD